MQPSPHPGFWVTGGDNFSVGVEAPCVSHQDGVFLDWFKIFKASWPWMMTRCYQWGRNRPHIQLSSCECNQSQQSHHRYPNEYNNEWWTVGPWLLSLCWMIWQMILLSKRLLNTGWLTGFLDLCCLLEFFCWFEILGWSRRTGIFSSDVGIMPGLHKRITAPFVIWCTLFCSVI